MEPLLRFVALLLKVAGFFLMPLLGLYNRLHYKAIKVPAPTDELLRLPAVDLAERIRNGQLSVVTVVRAYIGRIRLVNPLLNAVVEDRFEDALVEAERMDAMIAGGQRQRELATKYPLCGVPFTVKESCSLKGIIWLRLWGGALRFSVLPQCVCVRVFECPVRHSRIRRPCQ